MEQWINLKKIGAIMGAFIAVDSSSVHCLQPAGTVSIPLLHPFVIFTCKKARLVTQVLKEKVSNCLEMAALVRATPAECEEDPL